MLDELARRSMDEPVLASLSGFLRQQPVSDLLAGVFGASPYLTALIERDPAGLMRTLAMAPEERFAGLCRDLGRAVDGTDTLADAMRHLRMFKNDIALLTALCDLAGIWPVMSVTRRLSEAADAAVGAAVRFLFRQAARKGDWRAGTPDGYIVLGMGKYGAFELNYSSDIDLIVFYDLARIRLAPRPRGAAFLRAPDARSRPPAARAHRATATSSAPI